MRLRVVRTLVEMVGPKNTFLLQNDAPYIEQSIGSTLGSAGNSNLIRLTGPVISQISISTLLLEVVVFVTTSDKYPNYPQGYICCLRGPRASLCPTF